MPGTPCKVGCCGFGMGQPRYFRTFDLVEIQKTFYEPPQAKTARRWRDEAPKGFEFTVKAWQLITHESRSPTYRRLRTELSETQKKRAGAFKRSPIVRHAWERTREIAGLLGADKVLFQCPRAFRPTEGNKGRLRRFFDELDRDGLTCIWEPRGEWSDDEIAELCRRCGLVHCVDPFHARPMTGGMRYYRLHGLTGYRHTYTDAELQELAGKLPWRQASYVLFNNVSMTDDARRFRELVD